MRFISEKYEIFDGMATVLRTSQSGDVWQFRMYIKEEKKSYRKSLKTRHLPTALERGREEAARILSDVSTGRKIFGITLQEVVDRYLSYRGREVGIDGGITAGRLVTIKSQLRHLVSIVGASTRVAELDRDSLYDWYLMRTENSAKTVQKVTIRNETATINALCRYAYREGLIHFDAFNFKTLRIKQDEVGVRDTFTLDEYDALIEFMRSWKAKKNCSDIEERRRRQIIQDYVLISANSYLRVGEARQLCWGDVLIEKTNIDDLYGKKVVLANITVRAETSKVRVSRRVICRGGQYFQRLKENSVCTDDDALVFSFDGEKPIDSRHWTAYWNQLLQGIGISNWKERKLTWYSLRHFGITCRMKAGASIYDLAKTAGTSVAHIENTYAKYSLEQARVVALKNFKVLEDGTISTAN